MERTARGRYETHLDDPEFTVMEDGTRFAGFFLGDGADDPAVFPMEVTAGYRFPVHYHKTHYMSVILRGSLRMQSRDLAEPLVEDAAPQCLLPPC